MARLYLVLANKKHLMPHPFNPTTLFPVEGLTVDAEDPVWMGLIADGSLVEQPDEIDNGRSAKTKDSR